MKEERGIERTRGHGKADSKTLAAIIIIKMSLWRFGIVEMSGSNLGFNRIR